jgi:outer membrane phospholipase A
MQRLKFLIIGLAVAGSAQAQTAPSQLDQASQTFYAQLLGDGFLGSHITPYEPIYFLAGSNPGVEFQFSLKFRLTEYLPEYLPLYFAYTQTSYWDLFTRDAYFYDTSYKPSFFLRYQDIENVFDKQRHSQLGAQLGLEHESNGRGGSLERSLYSAYLQPSYTLGRADAWTLALVPRVWALFLVGNNNPDIATYRGHAELDLRLTHTVKSLDQFQAEVRLRQGDDLRYAGLWVDLRYKFAKHFNPILQIQGFSGYCQTLLQYNKYSTGLRAGFALWFPGEVNSLPVPLRGSPVP